MPDKKADSYEILIRRRQVFEGKKLGATVKMIAESLKVSEQTIYDDFEWLRSNAMEMAEAFDQKLYIGDFIRDKEYIKEKYWKEYKTADKGDVKLRLFILRLINEIMDNETRVLLDLGLIRPHVKPPIEEKSFETLIVDSRKERGLLPVPIETVTEKKIRMAKIEKKEEESTIAKKIREMKNKDKGGDKK